MTARHTHLPVTEAKARFSELLDRVAGGEQVTITRRGKPVVPLVADKRKLTIEERLRAHRDWITYRDKHKLTLGPDLTIQDLINEGRRF